MSDETKSIRVWEWRTSKYVTAEVVEEPILVVDGSQSWFEVDLVTKPLPTQEGIAVLDCRSHYAVYDELNLHWEMVYGGDE